MDIPSGNLWHSYWRCTPLSSLVGKSIQNAGSFYSYVNVYQRLSVFFYWIRSGFDLWFWVRISQIRKPWKIKVRIRGNKFITMNRSGRINELMCKPWDHNELNKPWKEDSIWIAVYCIADLEVHALVSLNWIMNGMDEWFEWFFSGNLRWKKPNSYGLCSLNPSRHAIPRALEWWKLCWEQPFCSDFWGNAPGAGDKLWRWNQYLYVPSGNVAMENHHF